MHRKKILYVITKSVWGGAQRYVFDLATNLPKDRFDVAVVTGGKGALTGKLEQAGIRTIPLPILQERGGFFEVVFSLANIRTLFSLVRIFRQEKPDIIHLNSSKIGGLGAVAAFFYKVTSNQLPVTIFTVHGWGFKEDRPLPIRALIFFISWFSSLFQNKIICINNADFKAAKKFIPRRKLALIFNGIGPIDFLPRAEARAFFAQKIGRVLTEDDIIIGTVAELTKNKGLNYLIDAINQMKLQTIIIGSGEDHEKLQKQIISLQMQDDIFLVGFIPDAARYLKAFDIFVLPSIKEGLPYTIMEAMSAGLPVIATNVGGIPDLVSDGSEGMLAPAKESNKLARAILELARDREKRRQLGEAGRKKIETLFRLSDIVAKTASLYSHD
ncbi:MAG: glycosyltransferase family 4 protein [Candidatus Sungbacteria bacterium]|nr:glycosyltransferase family 4 protein [Candidatus Sungbacteria bacterium]